MERYGMVIRLRPEKEEEYIRLHENAWPEVCDMIRQCNITNYSIFLRDGFLFSYWEYIGNNYEVDMQKMADDPKTREWWKLTDPCQVPVDGAEAGEKWTRMREVFHLD